MCVGGDGGFDACANAGAVDLISVMLLVAFMLLLAVMQ